MKGAISLMETAALILQGKDDFTASEPIAGALPLLRIVRTFKYAGVGRVVVAGEDYIMAEAFRQATRLEAEFIHATRGKRKAASYRVNALDHLKGKCSRLLLVPAYYPLFDINTVKLMSQAEAGLAAPVYNGKRGYPVLISSEFFDDMIGTDGDHEKLFADNPWQRVEVDDEGVTADVTRNTDAEKIAGTLSLDNEMRPGIKLTIRKVASCYGPGIQELIRLVEETGALETAYSLMGLSGSHARRFIKETENGLGFKLFDNDKNSKQEGTSVTAEAKEFAAKYEAFHQACLKSVESLFEQHFK